MPLPSCICVAGRPPFDRLGDIFCALSQIDLACVIPTVVSADLNVDVLTIVFSEEVTGQNGFTGFVAGVPVVFTYTAGEGTNTYTLQSDNPAGPGDDATLDYTPGDIESGPECPLAAFTDFPVTNNTGVTFSYLRPGGVDTYFRPGGVDTYIRP